MENKQEFKKILPLGVERDVANMSTGQTLKLTDAQLQEFQEEWESTSGDRKVFTKHDSGKLRYGLMPPLAEREMVEVLTFGAQKYSVGNWRNCDDLSRYVDAALRHISAYRMGQQKDEETDLHHLAHAMCCLSFIVDIEMGAPINRDDAIDSNRMVMSDPCNGCAFKGETHKECFDCVEGSEFKEVQHGA